MPHWHIKIGDLAAFMEKDEILEIDNDDMGHSGGESTSQFLAYGGHLNHDLYQVHFHKEWLIIKSIKTKNNTIPKSSASILKKTDYINVLES